MGITARACVRNTASPDVYKRQGRRTGNLQLGPVRPGSRRSRRTYQNSVSGDLISFLLQGKKKAEDILIHVPGQMCIRDRPYTQKDVLEYNGRYYVVGSGRQPLQRDKTQTEDYYLLTLAAIAKELEHRGAEHTASVHLAAGLPLTSFGRDKKSFRSYLYRDGSAIPFRYEGQDYTVTIQEVSLFPQGYACLLYTSHRAGKR